MTTRERFLALDTNRRKQVGFVLAIILAIGFVMMPPLPELLHLSASKQAQPHKPSAFGGTAPEPLSARVPVPSDAALFGVWQGQATLRDRGVCTLKLELRQGVAGRFVAYSSLICINLASYVGGPKPNYGGAALASLDRYNPVASVLSGSWEDGSVRFHSEKSIGANAVEGRCAVMTAALTPFGTGQLTSEWTDGICGGGQLLLKKVGP